MAIASLLMAAVAAVDLVKVDDSGDSDDVFAWSLNTRSRHLCRCGHAYAAHEHYRSGSDCSSCLECQHYRPARGLIPRMTGMLRGYTEAS
jgi:hypothetical protein